MTLDECRAAIGRTVNYWPGFAKPERGVIAEVGSQYVFVRYGSDEHAKATMPETLSLTTAVSR
jgi:hypothetical protein